MKVSSFPHFLWDMAWENILCPQKWDSYLRKLQYFLRMHLRCVQSQVLWKIRTYVLREECSLHKQALLLKRFFSSRKLISPIFDQAFLARGNKTLTHNFQFNFYPTYVLNRKALLKRRIYQYENFHKQLSCSPFTRKMPAKVSTNLEQIHFRDLDMSFHSGGVCYWSSRRECFRAPNVP
jgi:hypothetical protein